MTEQEGFSLLKVAPQARPLHIALAHCLAVAKVTDLERQATLTHVFATLTPGDKLACLRELHECKLAQRGKTEADVSNASA